MSKTPKYEGFGRIEIGNVKLVEFLAWRLENFLI